MKPIQNHLNDRSHSARRIFLLLRGLFLVGTLVWAGCKPDAKPAADTNPVGTYGLVSVDGKKVPCKVEHEGHGLSVKSGTFVINPDGTCSSKIDFSVPSGGGSVREVKAKYTREGSKLIMVWEGAGTTTGTIQGDTFTMDNEGMVFVYRKAS